MPAHRTQGFLVSYTLSHVLCSPGSGWGQTSTCSRVHLPLLLGKEPLAIHPAKAEPLPTSLVDKCGQVSDYVLTNKI